MGSTRLPGKSTMDLAGETLVGRILERVKRCKNLDEIILAIPKKETDKILKDIGKNFEINVFEGSENDLVERFYQAASLHKADLVCRLPADNPTPEPREIDRIIEYHINLKRRGFSSNLACINNSGYPDGIGAEIFDYSLLEEIYYRNTNPFHREHVHLNFFNYETGKAVDEKWCPVSTVKCPKEFRRPEIVLDVNTIEQYYFMKDLYEYLYPRNPNFHITDIISWFDNIYCNT